MPISRFICGKCGVEATRIGSATSYVPSVDSASWERLCVMAARARENGEPADPMSVDCPYLKSRVVAEPENAAGLADASVAAERAVSGYFRSGS
jgi:hypothetical protein